MITKSKLAELRKEWEWDGLAENPESINEMLDTIETLLEERETFRRKEQALLNENEKLRRVYLGSRGLFSIGALDGVEDSRVDFLRKALAALANTTGRSEGKE